jgi:RPA family protein
MLRPEVVDAVRENKFHIWAINAIDEGIAILTGREAGEPDEEGNFAEDTVYHAVVQRLEEMAKKPKDKAEDEEEENGGENKASGSETPPPEDDDENEEKPDKKDNSG